MKNIVTRNDDYDYARFGFEVFWPGLAQAEGLSATEFDQRLGTRARQVTDMIRHIHESFYMAPHEKGGLALTRIDTDPPPDVNDPEHMAWRRSRLRDQNLRFIGAYQLWGEVASEEDDGMAGLLVLSHDPKEPEAIEIAELDVRFGYRNTGVADALLRIGLHLASPDMIAELAVSETNYKAQHFYQKRGFVYDQAADGGLVAERHGVFDTEHLAMSAMVDTVLSRIDDIHSTRLARTPYLLELPESAAASL